MPVRLQHIGRLHILIVVILVAHLTALYSAQPVSYTTLTNDLPVFASLPADATAYYTFTWPAVASQQSVLLSVSAELGFPSLYVSLINPTPSAASFDYFASWQTGGNVSIVGQQQYKPPYTAYIAIVTSPHSRCNYTLLATAHDASKLQSTPVLLSNTEPVVSAIATGESGCFAQGLSSGGLASAVVVPVVIVLLVLAGVGLWLCRGRLWRRGDASKSELEDSEHQQRLDDASSSREVSMADVSGVRSGGGGGGGGRLSLRHWGRPHETPSSKPNASERGGRLIGTTGEQLEHTEVERSYVSLNISQ